jgi:adenosine deaminase
VRTAAARSGTYTGRLLPAVWASPSARRRGERNEAAMSPTPDDLADFVRRLPKAELHLHIEGTLEPEMAFAKAARHGIRLPYESAAALRAAYDFHDLQSFLDVYYAGVEVLRDAEDFRDLVLAYLERAHADGVVHTEIFFDPQSHTARGIAMGTVMDGLLAGLREGRNRFGIGTRLILCFLRHLDASDAMATLEAALPWKRHIAAVGLDSSEAGHPPSKFADVFARARQEGFAAVAHAGEEGPPAYIVEALDLLKVVRIDHGVRCEEDAQLCRRLAGERTPLTVCPLSNVKLAVFKTLADHNLARLLRAGIRVTINSDDPAYFGGYVGENYVASARALNLERAELIEIARNSIEASFMSPMEMARHLRRLQLLSA